MDIDKAIKILEQHQQWRLGDDEIVQTNARELTESINTILSEFKNLHLQNVSNRREQVCDCLHPEWHEDEKGEYCYNCGRSKSQTCC